MTQSTAVPDIASLTVVALRDEAQLDGLGDCWNALASEIPFRRWEWAQSWWRHYRRRGCQLFTLLINDEYGELVGIVPWYIDSSARRGRVVRFLGSGEACSHYLTLLCREELQVPVAQRLADWMATEATDAWQLIDLSGVEESDSAVAGFAQRMGRHGHVVDTQADLNCWREALPENWEQFLATLSKPRRSRTRRIIRDYIDTGRAVVHGVATRDELDKTFEILIDLHQKRRRSLSQDGCFTSPAFTAFHREVSARLLAGGRLRLTWIELDSRPMSAEYAFSGDGIVYYYQGGFEPELSAEGPGWISNAIALKLAVDDGYRGYDFLRGNESYKASWGAEARPLVRWRVVGRQPSARARWAAWRAATNVNRWARRMVSQATE